MICTFVGNSIIDENLENVITEQLTYLIENYNADTFLIGNQGDFDRLAYTTLKKLKADYPYLKINIISAYRPKESEQNTDIVYPECLKKATYKSAIPIRNKWMIGKSDIVLCYVKYKRNAYRFVELAKQKSKIIIDIS